METSKVFKYAYDAYTNKLNGQSKKAVKSFEKMYKEGVKNPGQAKYAMNDAYVKASNEYDRNPDKSEAMGFFNTMKTAGREMWEYLTNSEYRKAEKDFNRAYDKLYPRTGFAREFLAFEKRIPD